MDRIASLVTVHGELVAVAERRRPSSTYGVPGGFHTMFTRSVGELATKVRNGATVRLFLILPEHLSYDAFKRLNQTEIGAKLQLDNSSISRAMAELLALNVVERKGKGPYTTWRLSLDYGWRGDVDSYHAERTAQQKGPAAAQRQRPGLSIAAEGIAGKPATAQNTKAEQRQLRLLSSAKSRPSPAAGA